MSRSNTAGNFPASARLLHWAMAAIVLSMLFLGVSMIHSLAAWQHTALLLHKSLGIVALLLVVLRLINRFRIAVPPLPRDMSAVQRLVAKASHWLLYAAMVALPLSGWAMQSAGGFPVRPFGLFSLPAITPQKIELYGLMRELHGAIAWSLFALLLLHIGAALYHGWVRRDDVLSSMLGTASERP